MRFCAVVGGAYRVLGENWKLAVADLYVFALGGPAAPAGVEQRAEVSAAQGSKSAFEVGMGLIRGLVADFLTEVSLMGIVPTEKKSK